MEDCIKKAGEKLKYLLVPVIREDYPEISDKEINFAFSELCGSLESWFVFMMKWVVPKRAEFESLKMTANKFWLTEKDWPAKLPLPQILPGFTIKPVAKDLFEKVAAIMTFYLNLYDHTVQCQKEMVQWKTK